MIADNELRDIGIERGWYEDRGEVDVEYVVNRLAIEEQRSNLSTERHDEIARKQANRGEGL